MAIDPVFTTWRPSGQTLGVAESYRLVDFHDGDTPRIQMPIRMLSVDTPEVTARSAEGARAWDEKLSRLAAWIEAGRAPIDDGLAALFLPKLREGAGTLQFRQGEAAAEFGRANVAERLRRPDGSTRNLFVRTADQPFDQYGRLLAYIAPSYSPRELQGMTLAQRPTFNLDLVAAGWGAPFLIYPSLPKAADLELFVAAVVAAVGAGRGAWAEPLALPGYEYRMAQKLHDVTARLEAGEALSEAARKGWRSRLCVDMETRALVGPESYAAIPHDRRLWIWPDDVARATADFGLVPA